MGGEIGIMCVSLLHSVPKFLTNLLDPLQSSGSASVLKRGLQVECFGTIVAVGYKRRRKARIQWYRLRE